jgi:peptide/nickel transport system substrate-binding protein
MSQFWSADYSVDPSIWDFSTGWLPSEYAANYMLTGYEMPNANTVICNIRTDIYWQNIAPSYGRQFTSTDVVAHYDRLLGIGGQPADPYYSTVTTWQPLLSVVATDKFTVTFNWQQGISPVSILTAMQAQGADDSFEDSDAVSAYTNASNPILTNWHNAIGTGAFILTDFVDGSSMIYTANPNFFGHDFRWPQNQLPYISTLKILIITSNPSAEAAMRVGKIDGYGSMPVQDALNMMKTNPEIIVKQKPQATEYTLDPRNDVAPFNNLNVRIAMQHAIDIATITKTYYQGYGTPWPASLTQNQMGLAGWGCAYPDWPDSTQAQYTYDPTLAKQMLAVAGFPNGFNTDLVLETDADQGLYQIVQSELATVGINMSITTYVTASWQAIVLTGHKEDALSARNQGSLGFNNDIYRQLIHYGVATYQTNYILVNDPIMQAYYNSALTAQSVDAVQKIFHDVNLYIATQHYAISLAEPSTFNLVQPWIKGDPGAGTLGDTVTGAGFGDGVPVGVWIDQALKTSLEH